MKPGMCQRRLSMSTLEFPVPETVPETLELQSRETLNAKLEIFSLQTRIKSGNRWQKIQRNNLKEESRDTCSLYFGENFKTEIRGTKR